MSDYLPPLLVSLLSDYSAFRMGQSILRALSVLKVDCLPSKAFPHCPILVYTPRLLHLSMA
jgi:hypothetical protein